MTDDVLWRPPADAWEVGFWGDDDGARYRDAYFPKTPGCGITAT